VTKRTLLTMHLTGKQKKKKVHLFSNFRLVEGTRASRKSRPLSKFPAWRRGGNVCLRGSVIAPGKDKGLKKKEIQACKGALVMGKVRDPRGKRKAHTCCYGVFHRGVASKPDSFGPDFEPVRHLSQGDRSGFSARLKTRE